MTRGTTGGRAYLFGSVVLAAGALAVAAVLPPATARGLRIALVAALLVQGPLGWWLVRTVGTPAAMAVWGLGIFARFGLVAVMALVVVPAFGWPAEPVLVSLAGLLLGFLLLEGIVLMREQPQAEGR